MSASGGGGVCPRGLPRGLCPEECLPKGAGFTSPPVNKITDKCKNITFQQLRLRTVNNIPAGCTLLARKPYMSQCQLPQLDVATGGGDITTRCH